VLFVVCCAFLSCSSLSSDSVWDEATKILENAIRDGYFPGATAMVADATGVLYSVAVGSFTYGVPPPYDDDNPQMQLNTIFDMASISKVTAATTAFAQFYQRGEISLDTKVYTLLPGFENNGKKEMTVLNLLLHNSGFPADPVPSFNSKEFGCPETSNYYPNEVFTCQSKIYQAILDQTLDNPIGEVYVYSDLSMMTMMYVVGRLAVDLGYVVAADTVPECKVGIPGEEQCYYEAYVRKYVFTAFQMTSTQYLPNTALWSLCAPTENDTTYRHKVLQGQVHDPNTYAMGGISGHAGVFSNLFDIHTLAIRWLFASENDLLLNRTTADYFTKEYNHSQSSRALGWNTNDYTAPDQGWHQECGTLSENTFMHSGYTGTLLCADKERQLIVILLTNRVYPKTGTSIHDIQQAFTTSVQSIYDSLKFVY